MRHENVLKGDKIERHFYCGACNYSWLVERDGEKRRDPHNLRNGIAPNSTTAPPLRQLSKSFRKDLAIAYSRSDNSIWATRVSRGPRLARYGSCLALARRAASSSQFPSTSVLSVRSVIARAPSPRTSRDPAA